MKLMNSIEVNVTDKEAELFTSYCKRNGAASSELLSDFIKSKIIMEEIYQRKSKIKNILEKCEYEIYLGTEDSYTILDLPNGRGQLLHEDNIYSCLPKHIFSKVVERKDSSIWLEFLTKELDLPADFKNANTKYFSNALVKIKYNDIYEYVTCKFGRITFDELWTWDWNVDSFAAMNLMQRDGNISASVLNNFIEKIMKEEDA